MHVSTVPGRRQLLILVVRPARSSISGAATGRPAERSGWEFDLRQYVARRDTNMGQALQKLVQKKVDPAAKQKEQLRSVVAAYVDENYGKFQAAMDACPEPGRENLFYHFIYETIGGINAKIGAMQYKLPKYEEFHSIFMEIHPDQTRNLTKEEFLKIVDKLVGFEDVYLGQGFKDIALYMFGFPIVALFLKRLVPGSKSSMPDEVFVPAVTSATVVYLARKNKL